MCGRYSLTKNVQQLLDTYEVTIEEPGLLQPNYNAAPSQLLPVITNEEPKLLQCYKWGLVPFWAKEAKIGNNMVNIRSDTVAEKPFFHKLLETQRCIIPADGFYEWKQVGKKKQPYRFIMKDEAVFSLAGLWDTWNHDGETLHTFTLITTDANATVGAVHNRMPVILHKEEEKIWLNEAADADDLLEMLRPFEAKAMKSYAVSPALNNVSNNAPELLKPVAAQEGLF